MFKKENLIVFSFLFIVLLIFILKISTVNAKDFDDLYIKSGGTISYIHLKEGNIKYYDYAIKNSEKDSKKTVNNIKKNTFYIAANVSNKNKQKIANLLNNYSNIKLFKNSGIISIETTKSELNKFLENLITLTKIKYVQRGAKKTFDSKFKELKGTKKINVDSDNLEYAPRDPLFEEQWYLYNSDEEGVDLGYLGYRKFIDEQNYKYNKNNPPVIAIVDIGIYYDTPELLNRVYVNSGEIPNNNVDDDNNGYIDDYRGVDIGHPECTLTECIDGYEAYHGTAMSSIIAAKTDNNMYMTGLLPDEAKILPLSASSDYSTVDKYNEAYDYILEMKNKGVNIVAVNVSAGGPYDRVEYSLIEKFLDANILVVAAAGNENKNIDNSGNGGNGFFDIPTGAYPAAYDLDNIISVGAINRYGEPTVFTNYGHVVDIYMPGEEIISLNYPPSVIIGSGTSQAAAVTSGVVGIAAYLYPNCVGLELKDLLLDRSSQNIGSFTVEFTNQILNRLFASDDIFNMNMIKLSSSEGDALITESGLNNVNCNSFGIGR